MKIIHWGRPLEEQKPQPATPNPHTDEVHKGGAVVAPPCRYCGAICISTRVGSDIRFTCPNCKDKKKE